MTENVTTTHYKKRVKIEGRKGTPEHRLVVCRMLKRICMDLTFGFVLFLEAAVKSCCVEKI